MIKELKLYLYKNRVVYVACVAKSESTGKRIVIWRDFSNESEWLVTPEEVFEKEAKLKTNV